MDEVVRGLNWECMLVYMDDIFVYSKTFEDHLGHLDALFARLRDANLKLRAAKCNVCQDETPYLGHIITADGCIKMDPKKVESMRQFELPKTLKELQRFLGLTGYYRHFIEKYADLAAPLTDIMKRQVFHGAH